ncbi:hypothetical protein [Rhizobium mongolense]|uniref:Uncharacterized protein n=2 Tax=Rhizobium mongolense TaxID=57676 RepID=A0ABR6IWA8_9HYPH|nr:hypothetical protein [Rhizobium mongolense]MBB4232199.1 hypothetical protein [Rhizobium mongolense]TVZ63081.1 hypothetical protein BCL32_3197 [Rhizobium mongolense USDA 1844]
MRPQHLTNDYLIRLRYGETLSFAIPSSPTYGIPTKPLDYRVPLPFEGKREPSIKSPFNYRGTMVGINDNRIMPFESKVERNAEIIFQTDPRIARIKPQPLVIKYTAADGKEKKHIVDFLLHKVDGSRALVAAKPTLLLVRTGLVDLLLRLWDQGRLTGIADSLSFVTEKYASDEAAYNASEIIKARRLRNEAEYDIALNILKNVRGPVRFCALLAGAEPPAHRRTALWNLIDEKRLRPVKAGRIEDHSLMTVTL